MQGSTNIMYLREFTFLVYYGRQTSLCSNNKII